MSIALLANENFPSPAIRKLRAAGVDVVAVGEAMPAVSDKEVMEFARREQRWIVTFDRDYGDLIFREGLLPPPAILYISGKNPTRRIVLPIWFWRCFPSRSKRKAVWLSSANIVFGASIFLPAVDGSRPTQYPGRRL